MKKSSRMKTILLAGVLALGMCLSSMTAMAEEITEENQATLGNVRTITKTLQLPEGMNIDSDLTFNFTATSETADAPTATIQSVIFETTDFNKTTADGDTYTNGLASLEETTQVTFGNFTKPGKYVYEIKEKITYQGAPDDADPNTLDTYAGEGIRYAENEYTMYVYVERTDDEDAASAGTAADGTKLTITAVTVTKKGDDANGQNTKLGSIDFTNVLYQNGGGDVKPNPEDETQRDVSLTISKQLSSSFGQADIAFPFKITLTKSGTETNATASYSVEKYLANGQKDTTFETGGTGTVTVGSEFEFTLKAGEKLVFPELPAGTRYDVTEVNSTDATKADGYIPSYTVTEDGGTPYTQNAAGSDGTDLSTGSRLVGEDANNVVFTNNSEDIAITGIFMDILPFAILIAAAVAGLTVYIVVRKKVRAAR